MTPLELDAAEYLLWLQVHNYADTTVGCRTRYLAYFAEFCSGRDLHRREQVTFELLQDYQQRLRGHHSRHGGATYGRDAIATARRGHAVFQLAAPLGPAPGEPRCRSADAQGGAPLARSDPQRRAR